MTGSAGATAMEEGRNEQRSTADDQETAERLASLEQHQREVDQAIGCAAHYHITAGKYLVVT